MMSRRFDVEKFGQTTSLFVLLAVYTNSIISNYKHTKKFQKKSYTREVTLFDKNFITALNVVKWQLWTNVKTCWICISAIMSRYSNRGDSADVSVTTWKRYRFFFVLLQTWRNSCFRSICKSTRPNSSILKSCYNHPHLAFNSTAKCIL